MTISLDNRVLELKQKIALPKEENLFRLNQVKAEQSKWSGVNNEIKMYQSQLGKLEAELAKLPPITEHALLRFAERVEGFNSDAAKQKIFTPEFLNQFRTLGDGHYPVDGFTVVVREGIIKTILNNIKS